MIFLVPGVQLYVGDMRERDKLSHFLTDLQIRRSHAFRTSSASRSDLGDENLDFTSKTML